MYAHNATIKFFEEIFSFEGARPEKRPQNLTFFENFKTKIYSFKLLLMKIILIIKV